MPRPLAGISHEKLDAYFASVGQKLREGLSGEAEKILRQNDRGLRHTPDNLANLKRLLSFTLETTGRYKESLEAIEPFEDEDKHLPSSLSRRRSASRHSSPSPTTT